MSPDKFKELLERARKQAAEAKQDLETRGIAIISEQLEAEKPVEVDLSRLGTGIEELKDEDDAARHERNDATIEAIRDIASTISERQRETEESLGTTTVRNIGVAKDIILNENQQRASDLITSGESIVLIGAAGTGKTTSTRRITQRLIEEEKLPKLTAGTKWLQVGLPGAAIVSYTRKAVNNIRHAVVEDLKPHVVTIHKLIEFAPVFYEIEDPDKPGEFKKTMRFEPTRNAGNPLPPELRLIIHEESSMESVELYAQLHEALPNKVQEVFLGDIQQLPPVFGLAILGFKMLELPVVELTEVYRQARNSPIIDLAWKILEGNPHVFSPKKEKYKIHSAILDREVERFRVPALKELTRKNDDGEVIFQPWQKQLSSDHGVITAIKQFCTWADNGYYNPEEDIILCPFNKAFGTIELNLGIMQHLGTKRGATVYEVIAGFNKHYLAVGDRVLYDKEDAFITHIAKNPEYLGKPTMPASTKLDRWGHYREAPTENEVLHAQAEGEDFSLEAIEAIMDKIGDGVEERVQAASHTIEIKYAFSDEVEILETASEINNLLGGYALTVHKFQGSEEERVFIVLHQSHAVMISRELLYTAVTRAKKFLHIICEADTFYKGVMSQRIKGNTLLDKAEFFKGKKEEVDKYMKLLEEKEKGEFKPSVAAAKATPAPIQMAETPKAKIPLVKLSNLVSGKLKLLATQHLEVHWNRAISIWGKEKLGNIPTLDFNLQTREKLGTANFKTGVIKLNPAWIIASEESPEIAHEMFHNTLIHEVCHIVAYRYSRDYGHSSGWAMAMQLMGLPPDRVYSGDTLPPWSLAYKEAVEKKMQQLAEEAGADISEQYEQEDGEQA